MKNYLLTILLLFVTTITFSQIRISGTVIDATSKAPLNRTVVTLNGAENTLITDETGFFTVVLKESGLYDLSISKNGYKSLSESLFLNENIEMTIALTSNEGTEKPEYTSNASSIKKNANYLRKDEYSKLKDAKEKEVKIAKEENVAVPISAFENTHKKMENDKMPSATKNKKHQTDFLQLKKDEYILSGTIRDKYTKETLAKAEISFIDKKKTYMTTSDGAFNFSLEEGDAEMLVTLNGYKTETAKIPVFTDLDFTILLTKEDIKTFTTEDVVISGTRATSNTPTTFSTITKEDITINNLGKDLPYLLELTPSLVASSDGGNGTGYTSMRIRGSDMTRINFTLNGFPMNDAESQGVFLVDLPDLASDVNDIQIQRGIGTSTNGAGAFGASVNINTNKKRSTAYAEFHNSFGSFATLKNTIMVGTGLLFDHFTVDGRFSHLMTDGYIDRAEAKMFAYSLNAAYYNKKSVVRFNVFSGKETTYQAWNGVSKDQVETDRRYNSAGTDYGQKAIPYDNEIDNYKQDNYQLAFSHQFTNKISANLGVHYTKGKGYFEQYKVDQDLLSYGVINATDNTDLVRRRWLDNDFYGAIFSTKLKTKLNSTTLGGGWNRYDGDHFGEVIWAKDAKNVDINEYYYNNKGLKTDFNVFLKSEFTFNRFIVFGDVQYRRVDHKMKGIDHDQVIFDKKGQFNFINPKVGLTYLLGKEKRSQVYASFAMANKEPSRNDFIDNAELPKHESMMNVELGFRHHKKLLKFGINSFYMKYKNQLVLTGELNDVGSAVRANVDNSFRTGLELDLAYEPIKYFGVKTTATWSINEIDEYTTVNYLGDTITHDKTKISYSPMFNGNLTLYSRIFKGFELAVINKFVSEQFLDNTTTKKNTLAPYYLLDARISYSIKPRFMNEIQLIFKANNLLNTKYSTNGYVYYDSPYYYPQAGTNFEGGVNLKF